jgi:asparagine synthase (glutamine-hydrolysing)
MCGIVGTASKFPVESEHWLSSAIGTLVHRGPDGIGEWWSSDRRVGLGHTRLAVLELSPAGYQPMHLEGLSIVFNGEIYNHSDLREELSAHGFVFRSHSDTEVLLAAYAAWGQDCLTHLNGMFSFALYDALRQRVFVARDRAGEKPLFYHLAHGTLHFSSELKGLMANPALPRHINPNSLDCYLAMGYVPGERCILEGYNKLSPAHALSFDLQLGTAKVWRYWQVPDLTPEAAAGQVDEIGLLDELEALLEDSVRRQLAADVPVGVLLSGGVDSSLITAMAVRASRQVKTFTVGFPGFGKYDESEHARLIASHFGTEHINLEAGTVDSDLLQILARQFDEPMVDSSMIPTFLVSQLVKQYCTVALGGDGGDELFGGYGHYNRLLWMQGNLGKIPLPLRKAIALGAQKLPIGLKGRNWLQGLGVDLQQGLPLIASYFDASSRRQLMAQYPGWELVAESIYGARIPRHSDLLQRATRMDFQDYLAEDILVKVDRASMINSLEVRAPLLDYRLIEFAFGKVPSYLKGTAHDKKILLKRLTSRVLPPEFDRQRKQGFSIPLADWLKAGSFLNLFQDVLLDAGCLFDRRIVIGLLNGQAQGHNNGERLFALVLFELWRREYKITI